MFFFVKAILIITLIALFLFHIMILLQILPYSMVWGSRLKSKKEMLRFESISLVVTGIFIWLAMEATGDIEGVIPSSWSVWILWGLAFFFGLNTLGNLTSKNQVERYGFSIGTIILVGCCVVLALSIHQGTN
jgi:hypothetical protein